MRFALLGPLEARRGGTPLDLGPPKRRVLLIRLLLAEGRPVPAEQLCQDLWEGHPPSGAASSLHAHISRLRSSLEPQRTGRGGHTLLVSSQVGYALHAARESRDTARFEDAVDRARQLLARGRTEAARQEVAAALRLWRGAALGDAVRYSFAAREIDRLEEIRQSAEEMYAAILIQQGEPERAVVTAERLTSAAPLREASWALLMRALYLSGRPTAALQRYQEFRTLLGEELGLDPGPALRELQVAVLRHDTAAVSGPPPLHAVSPRRTADMGALPLVGRDVELDRLGALVPAAAAGRTQWAVISGPRGAGKTRLAEELADRAATAGFTVLSARCGPAGRRVDDQDPLSPVAQLLSGLRRIGTPGQPRTGTAVPTPAGQGERPCGRRDDAALEAVTRLAAELAHRPVLCLIDGLHGADPGVARLLGLAAALLREVPLLMVCTVRDDEQQGIEQLLADLTREGACRLGLGPLTVEDTRELLAAHDCDPLEAAALHRRSQGIPFTLRAILALPADRRSGPRAQVPDSVATVLRADLARLGPAAQAMLETAAVAGEYLDTDVLPTVCGISREQLLLLIDAAVTARLVVWDDEPAAGRPGRYRIPELPREVVLESMSPARRQMLHAAVARALVGRPGTHPSRTARHLLAAGPLIPTERLARAALTAGWHCAEDGRREEAACWYEKAAAAAAHHPALRTEALERMQRLEWGRSLMRR
ncbi:BTAD domain-containing putative transcriptional regulator [Streptacidiphilus griseoplanus]|uniref:BTAD domain-containing putative transcriptional regulator n=1 Tax=Peterkaempfera griseoplana TaxID=66896 RepID=UPI001FE22F64|nr:BTAD domain-containing putative transcriptional regulator [Peterkaempfera griseoplana]